jgi:hypothetical protein
MLCAMVPSAFSNGCMAVCGPGRAGLSGSLDLVAGGEELVVGSQYAALPASSTAGLYHMTFERWMLTGTE